MTTKTIPLYSKSSVGVDNTCKRKYWWAYKFDGTGIQAKGQGLELFIGSALHDGLAAIAQDAQVEDDIIPIGIDTIASTAFSQIYQPMVEAATNTQTGEIQPEDVEYAQEQATLVEGLLRGFHRHIWPRLMNDYTIAFFERPMIYKHHGLGMMVKSDLVLRSKITGGLTYVEYKSTSSKNDQWVRSWETNVQLHSSIRAIEQACGEEVEAVIVQGLYKGYESYGKQSSPFCYAYKKAGNPPFTTDQVGYKYLSGWKRSPTWELEGGCKRWVENMPEEILQDQFPQTPPIFINNDLIDAFYRQQAERQYEVADAMADLAKGEEEVAPQEVMDRVFPQNFEECSPAWGSACPYQMLCHGSSDANPLDMGFAKRTTDHLKPFYEVLEQLETT